MKKGYIFLGFLALIMALSSCVKDDMEVQKNKDLTWSIDDDIVNDDIRTRIGYDPRLTYGFVTKETDISIQGIAGVLIATDNGEKKISVELSKPAKSPISVTIAYDASLFDKVKDKYVGYTLGSESVINFTEKTKTIEAGQTKIEFSFTSTLSDTEKVLFPFSVTMQGDQSIECSVDNQGEGFFVIRSLFENSIKKKRFSVDKSESSEVVRNAWKQCEDNIVAAYATWGITASLTKVDIGAIDNGIGVNYTLNENGETYENSAIYDIEDSAGNLQFTQTGTGGYWQYFGDNLRSLNDLIKGKTFKVEKVEGAGSGKVKIKLTDTTNENVYFVMTQ